MDMKKIGKSKYVEVIKKTCDAKTIITSFFVGMLKKCGYLIEKTSSASDIVAFNYLKASLNSLTALGPLLSSPS